MSPVRTAIIPAAGLGTRMAPATQAIPKELLPIGKRPAIDWILDEAVSAGIEEVIIVTSDRKPAISAYLGDGQRRSSRSQDEPSKNLEVRFVTQSAPRGLGDAILCGWRLAGDQPIAVLLPDELMLGDTDLLSTMIDYQHRLDRSVVALMRVPLEEIGSYGCAAISGRGPEGTLEISACLEKPDPCTAMSNFAICGRYLLAADIYSYLAQLRPGADGEVQLTPALNRAAEGNGLFGCEALARHQRIDVGSWSGWLRANQLTLEGTGQVRSNGSHRNHLGQSAPSLTSRQLDSSHTQASLSSL